MVAGTEQRKSSIALVMIERVGFVAVASPSLKILEVLIVRKSVRDSTSGTLESPITWIMAGGSYGTLTSHKNWYMYISGRFMVYDSSQSNLDSRLKGRQNVPASYDSQTIEVEMAPQTCGSAQYCKGTNSLSARSKSYQQLARERSTVLVKTLLRFVGLQICNRSQDVNITFPLISL